MCRTVNTSYPFSGVFDELPQDRADLLARSVNVRKIHSREGCSWPAPVSTRMMVRSQSRHARTTTTWLMLAVTRALSQSSHTRRVNDPSALTQC